MHPILISGLAMAFWPIQLAAARTIQIKAGDVYFDPPSVNATAGDVLEFLFLPHNHSVVMGDIDTPCQPASTGGFYSGFLPVSSGESTNVFQVTINDTNPFVYYCSQNASGHNHCKGGMIGFVNESDEDKQSSYISAAANSTINISPDQGPFGGVFAAASAGANSTANATTTTAGPSSSSTGSTAPAGTTTGAPIDNAAPETPEAGSGLFAALLALLML